MEFNYEFEGIYMLAFISFVVIMLTSLFDRKLNKSDILEFVDDNINDYEFRQDVVDLTRPRVGEVVENISSPWFGMLGYVTRINEDESYNVKVTKTLNPDFSRVPKRVITKFSEELELY